MGASVGKSLSIGGVDVAVVRQIGEGGYGKVFLARKSDTSEICAVKRMSKSALARRGAVRLSAAPRAPPPLRTRADRRDGGPPATRESAS